MVVLKGGIKAEAVIDPGATTLVIGWKLGKKLGLARRRLPVHISQADGNRLKGGSQGINSPFRFLE